MRHSAPQQPSNAAPDNGNSSWLLRAYLAVSSAVLALWSLVYPPAPVIPPQKPRTYTELPDDIKRSFNTFLGLKDRAALIVSKEQQGLFQPDLNGLKLLRFVVRGEQEKADRLLTIHPELLLKRDTITDYSGRTFNCTAYEYAYWAKDTHICRMLESHMDDVTKTQMLEKIDAIDRSGLVYQQHGVSYQNQHFDMTPLKTALQKYVDEYDALEQQNDYDAMKAAWMLVGLAQRDLPVHVINEYCRPGRTFGPLPAFNEDKLPRILTYYNFNTSLTGLVFPLVVSGSSGLGVDFALARHERREPAGGWGAGLRDGGSARIDLAAVSLLDEVRTADLTLSRENRHGLRP